MKTTWNLQTESSAQAKSMPVVESAIVDAAKEIKEALQAHSGRLSATEELCSSVERIDQAVCKPETMFFLQRLRCVHCLASLNLL